jgi:uncharacterized protein
MKDKFFLLVGLVIIAGSIYLFLDKPAPQHYQSEDWRTEEITFPENTLRIGGKTISVEIADTNEERAQGLSGRERLALGTGMLFVFEEPALHGFWMKDMNFSIDIVWIDENWTVVSVDRGVLPKTFPKAFYPASPAKYVLELNSGVAAELGIDTGREVFLE